jgi:hypothetical protein
VFGLQFVPHRNDEQGNVSVAYFDQVSCSVPLGFSVHGFCFRWRLTDELYRVPSGRDRHSKYLGGLDDQETGTIYC